MSAEQNFRSTPDGRLISSGSIRRLGPGEVFVFGSNAGGMHGGGAARFAHERFGAVWGQGHGLQGQSYAIDTMSGFDALVADVAEFLDFAEDHPELTFLVTEVGCDIAGYAPADVAPAFRRAGRNVALPASFAEHLNATGQVGPA